MLLTRLEQHFFSSQLRENYWVINRAFCEHELIKFSAIDLSRAEQMGFLSAYSFNLPILLIDMNSNKSFG